MRKKKKTKVWNFSMELCMECMDTCLEVQITSFCVESCLV